MMMVHESLTSRKRFRHSVNAPPMSGSISAATSKDSGDTVLISRSGNVKQGLRRRVSEVHGELRIRAKQNICKSEYPQRN